MKPSSSRTPRLDDRLLGILKEAGGAGLSKSELKRRLGVTVPAAELHETVRHLLAEKLIVRRGSGQLAAVPTKSLSGRLMVHPRGFGFVSPDDGSADVFIKDRHLHQAMSGDHVLVRIHADQGPGSFRGRSSGKVTPHKAFGPSGEVVKILEQGVQWVVGKLCHEDGESFVRPLRRELPDAVPVRQEKKAHPVKPWLGHWVEAELLRPEGGGRLECRLVRSISGDDSPMADLLAVVAEYQLQPAYSAQECADAAAMEPIHVPHRLDCRQLKPLTIDPADAKDHDDAISIEPGRVAGTVRVGVHIADVAAYIRPGSWLDKSASVRSFTSYLPGLTLPMLPRPLAAVQCSLVADEDRLAHSVFLEISLQTGEILSSERHRTRIRVWGELTHDDTQAYLDTGRVPAHWPKGSAAIVKQLHELALVMRGLRAGKEQFLTLGMPEIRVATEGQGDSLKITGLKLNRGGTASDLVEEYMLAANTAVAGELIAKEIPGLYRIHDEPAQDSLMQFVQQVRKDFGITLPAIRSRKDLNTILSFADRPELRELLSASLLGILARARYSPNPGLHYGLGKTEYSHFTSPIRRYPDLLVHQQLLAHDLGQKLRTQEECAEIAVACSGLEQNNDTASFAAGDRLKLRYVAQQFAAGAVLHYDGVLSRLVGDSLLIYITALGFYGVLPLRFLGNDFFEVLEDGKGIVGRRTGQTYRCGDVLKVVMESGDFVKGRLTLRLAQDSAGRPRPAARAANQPSRPSSVSGFKPEKRGKSDSAGKARKGSRKTSHKPSRKDS